MIFNDLSKIKETTSLSKDWIESTNAKPTKVALWVIKNKLSVCGVYWKGDAGGAWDDENAVSMTDIILTLPIQ